VISYCLRVNPHQYTLWKLLIRTPGVHVRGPQRYFKLYDASPRHVVSEMVFSYLGHDVLRPVVFVGWFVRWLACVGVFVSMFVCSLTRFGVEYLENVWR